MPHKDIPTRQDIEALAAVREPHSISMYVPTGPLPSDSEKAKIELKNLTRDVVTQLTEAGVAKDAIAQVQDRIDALLEDTLFWTYQSQSLAIFLGNGLFQTYRLPNHFQATVDVADRFYIKPLMRTITFPQSAFVLALAQKSVRLVRVTAAEEAQVVDVLGLPTDLESFIGADMPERQKYDRGTLDMSVRVQQFAAGINKAVYPVVRDTKLPLILAAAEPLTSAYRKSNSYRYLTDQVIAGNPEALTNEQLATHARPILDELYSAEIADVVENFRAKQAQLLGSTDLEIVARGASLYAIDTVLVDFDHRLPGSIDEVGVITLDHADDASNYGVVDEIIRQALLVNARVYAVRSAEMPDGAKVAATFRFQVS